MEKTQAKAGLRQYLTVIILFVLTSLALAFTIDIRITDEAGVRQTLPDTIGLEWFGYEVLFCHNKECGRSWLQKDITPDEDGVMVCPQNYRREACGGSLHTMAYGEWDNLPKDTTIYKKQYFSRSQSNKTVYVSVVLSGRDRSSIHRPQVCLVGQGNDIVRSTVVDVPLKGQKKPLQIMVLDLAKKLPSGQQQFSYYAYWFVGKDRETPHHHWRMIWMGFDRIFRNVAHRWAYIAVSGSREKEDPDDKHFKELQDVIGKLYPEMTLIEGRQGSS